MIAAARTRCEKRLPRSIRRRMPRFACAEFFSQRNPAAALFFCFYTVYCFALRERTHNGTPFNACMGVAYPCPCQVFQHTCFFCCVGTLFARGVKDAERTTLPASLPKRTLFSIFSHRTHKGHTVPVRFLFLPRKEVV